MPDDANGVNIPVTSTFDATGTDAAAANLQKMADAGQTAGARLRELETEEAKAAAPIKPSVQPVAGAEQVESQLRGLTHDADEFLNALRLGVGINVGEKIVGGLEEIISKFREAIAEGVEYDKQIETATLGIAAALRSVEPEKFLNFDAARQQATTTLDAIREKANALGVEFHSLEGAYSASLNALVEGGVTDVGQQLDLVSTLIAAATAKGVGGMRALIDTVDILNGRSERVVLAKELGLQSEALKTAAANGTLYAEIIGKIGGYQEGLKAQADTLGAIEQRTHNLLEQLAGAVTVPVFEGIKDGLRDLDAELEKPAVVEALRTIGYEVGEIVRTGAGLLEFATRNAGALTILAEGTAAYGAALAAVKIVDFVAALGAKGVALAADLAATIAGTAAKEADTAATVADTAATEANTAAKAANAAATEAGAGGSFLAAAGLSGPLAVAVTVGLGLKMAIDSVTASTNAATAEADKLGASLESQRRTLSSQLQLADDFAKKQAARTAIEDALAQAEGRAQSERARGNAQNAGLLDQQAELLRHMLETFDQTAGKVVTITGHEEARRKTMEAQKKALEDQLLTIEKIDKEIAARAKKDDVDNATPQELQGRINAQLLNARNLLKQGGLELPYDLQLDPESILKFRDQLHAAGDTADAQAQFTALRAKISEVALSISDLERAHERAGAAADREATQVAKDTDKMIADRRKFIAALGEESTERSELQKRQQELHDAQTATDKDSEAGQKRIKDAVDAVTKAQRELQKAEAERQDAAAKAFPQDVARLNEIANLLKNMPSTGTAADADKRGALQSEQRRINDKLAGKGDGLPPKSLDDLEREAEQRAAEGEARDRAGLDQDEPDYSTPPSDRDAQGRRVTDPGAGPAVDDTATQNVTDATGKADDAAVKLADAAGQLPPALDSVKTGFDAYHRANVDGLNTLATGINQNMSDLAGVVGSQNAQIASLQGTIAQLQLQVGNLADSSDA